MRMGKDSARQKENCWVTWLVNEKASEMGSEKETQKEPPILLGRLNVPHWAFDLVPLKASEMGSEKETQREQPILSGQRNVLHWDFDLVPLKAFRRDSEMALQ
jgi:hypothetical protein